MERNLEPLTTCRPTVREVALGSDNNIFITSCGNNVQVSEQPPSLESQPANLYGLNVLLSFSIAHSLASALFLMPTSSPNGFLKKPSLVSI
jgi:hypothetical protein